MAEYKFPKYKYNPPEDDLSRMLAEIKYKSPLEVFSRGVRLNVEGEVMKAIHECEIFVDKDELIKALKYDREQYVKGFEDGCRERVDKLKAECAMEIFEDIQQNLKNEFPLLGTPVFAYINELKKKYEVDTNGEKEN